MFIAAVNINNQCQTDDVPKIIEMPDPVFGSLSHLATQELKIRPRQARAVKSVQRLLVAAGAALFRRGGAAGSTLEELASEAGMSPQAAYRYFPDVGAVTRVALRCIALREHERMLSELSGRVLPDEAVLGRAIAESVSEACRRLFSLPVHVRDGALREYGRAGQDGAPHIYGRLCEGASPADVRAFLSQADGAAAMVAVVAVATSLFSRDGGPPRHIEVERILASLFVSVLRDTTP